MSSAMSPWISHIQTFAVREGHMNSRAPSLNGELTKKRVQTEIEKALTARGLTASSDSPDLNVSFQFGSVRNMDTKAYAAGRRGLQTRVVNVPQSEGTMVIDLRDAKSNALVWHGTAMEGEPDPVKLAEKLDDMVKKAIARYPKLAPKKK
jgi:hypothetical protein